MRAPCGVLSRLCLLAAVLALPSCDDGSGAPADAQSELDGAPAETADLESDGAPDSPSPGPEDLELRDAWQLVGTRPADYDIELDFDVTRSGSGGSWRIESAVAEPLGTGGLALALDAAPLARRARSAQRLHPSGRPVRLG